MYLGMVLVALGVAISLGSATPFAFAIAVFAILDRRFVIAEEGMLAETFGDERRGYRKRVRRCI